MKLSVALAAACALGALAAVTDAAPTAAPTQVAGFSYVKSLAGIDEYRLDSNGLDVLLMPDHSAPVVTFMVTYRVGSRNEVTGTTGATHLLEHLMFKGSDALQRRQGQQRQAVPREHRRRLQRHHVARPHHVLRGSRQRVSSRATWRSRPIACAISGCARMDRRPEMTVVRNEFEIGENDPVQALDKEIFATAYQAHPYHHSTIGWRSDIEKVPIEKLRAFYDTFYWPDNATVSVIGDFKPDAALGLVKKYYGVYPKAPNAIPVGVHRRAGTAGTAPRDGQASR